MTATLGNGADVDGRVDSGPADQCGKFFFACGSVSEGEQALRHCADFASCGAQCLELRASLLSPLPRRSRPRKLDGGVPCSLARLGEVLVDFAVLRDGEVYVERKTAREAYVVVVCGFPAFSNHLRCQRASHARCEIGAVDGAGGASIPVALTP